MTKEEAKQLIAKYNAGQCTEEEKTLVESWYEKYNDHDIDITQDRIEELRAEVCRNLPGSNGKSKIIKLWSVIVAVASLSLIAVSVLVFYKNSETISKDGIAQDIRPGGNKATITLTNGKTIHLSGVKTGIAIHDTKISYNDGTTISNNSSDNFSGQATISVPKGGEYQIVLSDGTKVWLNAASTLTFATSLKERGEEKRRVRLSGEAYFEVSKDKKRPFVVTTGQQEVLVLGTHFNVNAYEPEIAIKTTLLEGSVRVSRVETNGISRNSILRPGEQAICFKDATLIKKVDVDLELAWKNGNTEFENADLKTIMAMVERWYNVEVSYQGKPNTTRFTGSVSRSRNISEILNFLESTGAVHFKIEGRRVIAMN